MYARSTTIRGNPGSVHDGVAYAHEAMPTIQAMDGCIGLSMLADRETGHCIITTAWESEEVMRASGERVRSMRERLADTLDGQGEVREWEIAVLHRAHPAEEGACARVTWVQAEPGGAGGLLERFRTSLMPQIQDMPGFCSLSLLLDRRTDRAVGTTVFDDRASLEGSRERARGLREESATTGVRVLDVAEMDVVLAHLRVPETV